VRINCIRSLVNGRLVSIPANWLRILDLKRGDYVQLELDPMTRTATIKKARLVDKFADPGDPRRRMRQQERAEWIQRYNQQLREGASVAEAKITAGPFPSFELAMLEGPAPEEPDGE
jgi:hypothetical protein